MKPETLEKLERLRELMRSFDGCAVAYSGGVDSTLLVAVGQETLGERCLAVLATSSTYPRREYESAIEWLVSRGVRHLTIASEELDIPGFSDNPPDRCYYCKQELFTKIRQTALAAGLPVVADGTNADDTGDFRPGLRAVRELDIRSPLLECGITKAEIREISREVYSLPTAEKQPMACMSSRFPYGSKITRDKLAQVEAVEDFLSSKGFKSFRARHHGDVLRLEVSPDEIPSLLQPPLRDEVVEAAKSAGFVYVTVDLQGFRSGSMNETLA